MQQLHKRLNYFKAFFLVTVFLSIGIHDIHALNPEQKMNRFTLECFDSSKGLPQNTVTDIFQDNTGFILFGTQEGLVKYDGHRFTDISTEYGLNASNRNITKINQLTGNIVVGTGSGIIETKSKKEEFKGIFIKDFIADKKGNLWIATYSSGVIKVGSDGKKEEFKKENAKINSNVIMSLYLSSKGTVFAGTLEGLSKFSNDSFIPVEGIYSLSHKIVEDKNGNIWVATERGLALLKEESLDYIYTLEDGIKDENLRTVFVDRSNVVWIGTESGGLTRFYNGKFSYLPNKNAVKTGSVISIIEDREGNIWFGSEATGACILRDGTVFQAGIDKGNIRSLTETKDGDIWAATFGEGIKILKKDETVLSITEKNGLRSDSISTIYAASDGKIWIGSRRNGVQIFYNGKFSDFDSLVKNFSQFYPISPTLFFEDSRGNIWIADRHSNRPVFLWNDGNVNTFEITKGEISILDIAENGKGIIYLVSMKNGVFEYDANNNEFKHVPLKKEAKTTSMFFDKKNRMFVTTLSGGLLIKHENDLIELNEEHGLYNNTVHDIIQDNYGSYWFSTNRGIFTVSEKEMDSYISGLSDKIKFILYKEEDGMPAGECNGGSQPSIIKSADGTLWFPTIRGVVTIDPSKIEQRIELPPVSISSAVLNHSETVDLWGINSLSVQPGIKSILINFTSLFFSHPGKVRFEYFLEGFDKHWNLAGESRNVVYTNIPPGRYNFSVKSYLADNPENFSTTSIKLNIKPFFYQDNRFRLIAALILLILMFAAYNIKIRLHKQREKHLKEMVDFKTDELLKANEKLRQSLLKDPMTGLCNRRYLFEIEQPKFESLIFAAQNDDKHSDRRDIPVNQNKVTGLFLIDIEGLKKINEKKGYDFGDKLLIAFADKLKKSVRKDDLVIRWGGDEFLVVLNFTDFEHLHVYAKKVVSFANDGIVVNEDHTIKFNVAIGFSAMPFYSNGFTLNFEENLLMSDMALYKALTDKKYPIKHAVPGTSVPTKEDISLFMKDIDEGVRKGFFNFLDV